MRLQHHGLIALALLAACGGGAVTATSAPVSPAPATNVENDGVLVAVDVFGTDPETAGRVLATHGDELRALGEALIRHDPAFDRRAAITKVRDLGDFAHVDPALVGYFEDDGMKYYLTIDVVGQHDVARRMPFLAAPAGSYPDPDGLIEPRVERRIAGVEEIRRDDRIRIGGVIDGLRIKNLIQCIAGRKGERRKRQKTGDWESILHVSVVEKK